MSAADVATRLPDQVRPLRRAEYDRLVAAGTFADERVELLGGVLVAMSPQGPTHAGVVELLTRFLAPLAGTHGVRIHLPLAVDDDSEPEPDIAIVPAEDHRGAHPDSALLVIEVCDSSHTRDLSVKPALYAAAGIPDYWVVDLAARCLHVHRSPAADAYREVHVHPADAVVRPLVAPDLLVPLTDLLD